jgi:hypothetical protein
MRISIEIRTYLVRTITNILRDLATIACMHRGFLINPIKSKPKNRKPPS